MSTVSVDSTTSTSQITLLSAMTVSIDSTTAKSTISSSSPLTVQADCTTLYLDVVAPSTTLDVSGTNVNVNVKGDASGQVDGTSVNVLIEGTPNQVEVDGTLVNVKVNGGSCSGVSVSSTSGQCQESTDAVSLSSATCTVTTTQANVQCQNGGSITSGSNIVINGNNVSGASTQVVSLLAGVIALGVAWFI